MQRIIVCRWAGGEKKAACVSFQPDGSVSLILTDRNAFEGRRLHPTFHPIAHHHITQTDRPKPFSAVQDFSLLLESEGFVRWARATSHPLKFVDSGSERSGADQTEMWAVNAPSDDLSLRVAVDLMKPPAPKDQLSPPQIVRYVDWHGTIFRVSMMVVPPQPAEVEVFHSY